MVATTVLLPSKCGPYPFLGDPDSPSLSFESIDRGSLPVADWLGLVETRTTENIERGTPEVPFRVLCHPLGIWGNRNGRESWVTPLDLEPLSHLQEGSVTVTVGGNTGKTRKTRKEGLKERLTVDGVEEREGSRGGNTRWSRGEGGAWRWRDGVGISTPESIWESAGEARRVGRGSGWSLLGESWEGREGLSRLVKRPVYREDGGVSKDSVVGTIPS